MNLLSMRSRLAIALILFVIPAVAGDASAGRRHKRKAKAACGLSYLPFVEGAVWKYHYTAPEHPPETKGLKLIDPPGVTIRVLKVESKRKSAEITLEESHRDFKRETHLRCNDDGLFVDPQSFFFAGEVGGGLGAKLEHLERPVGQTWPSDHDFRPGERWREEISADVVREAPEGIEAKHEPGRIEVEREAVVHRPEMVTSGLGDHPHALRVEVAFTGRAFVRVREKPVAMPSAKAVMWFVPDLGIVRVENRLGQGWTLTEHTLPGAD